MVQGLEGHPRHKGAYDILSKILRTQGVTGLYKGYSLPFITPSLSIWWGTYNVSQVQFAKLCQDDQILRGFSHAVSGLLAGLLTSAFNQPFDVVSTRLQVHMKKEKTRDVVKEMYKKNGYRGFYKGLGPRACWVSITGAAYGFLCHCLKAEATVEVTKK
jgi:solute carrier family 25 S-adenosylmethionine transporter 26